MSEFICERYNVILKCDSYLSTKCLKDKTLVVVLIKRYGRHHTVYRGIQVEVGSLFTFCLSSELYRNKYNSLRKKAVFFTITGQDPILLPRAYSCRQITVFMNYFSLTNKFSELL